MSRTRRTPTEILRAAEAIAELAVLSLAPEHQRWDRTVNLGMVEQVWNGCTGPALMGVNRAYKHIAALYDALLERRTQRWPNATYMVFGLDARHEDGEIVFSFDLSWDRGETLQPCEMVWDTGG